MIEGRIIDARRTRWLLAALALCGACPGDGDGTADEGSTGTDASTTGTTGMTAGTTAPTTTLDPDTTGGPPPTELQPCDPLADDCGALRCGGAPSAGYYCRPPCSSMAADGDACSDGGVCLPTYPGSTELACVVLHPCDPTTGDGCDLGDGESCVVVDLEPVRTACEPAGSGGVAEPCGPVGANGCDVGLGCLGSDLQDGDVGYCTPWCTPPGPDDAACPVCVPLGDGLGSCAECDVLDDTCAAGSQCQPINEALGGVCVEFGPGGEGDPCSPLDPAQSCQDGLVCLEATQDVYGCVATCDPAAPMCVDPATSCIDIGFVLPGIPTGELGLCLAGQQQFCDPAADPTGCDPDEVCFAVSADAGICGAVCDPTEGDLACPGNAACFPEQGGMLDVTPFAVGNGACGAGCTDDDDCGGGTCLLVEGLASAGICGASCDPAAPLCDAGQTCVATTGDPMVGACVVGGAACAVADPFSCVGMAEGSCVVLDGGDAAVCMAACFAQDPNACAGEPAACQVRTDAAFHAGVCIGQEPPCDPLLQDCGDGLACVVTGGAAIGGAAFVCRSAGPLDEGGDCSADDGACGIGLQCVADVCVALCDPAADDCTVGACTDAAAALYLPAGTLGFCL